MSFRITENKLQVGDHIIAPKKNNFNLKLKVTSKMITVVNEQPSGSHGKVIANLNVNSVESAWKACKSEHKRNKETVEQNDVVLAKVRGHQPWPAIILDLYKKNNCRVEFFGAKDYEKYGLVSFNEITFFKNSSQVIKLVLQKKIPKYVKAVLEAEFLCKIPSHASLTNIIKSK